MHHTRLAARPAGCSGMTESDHDLDVNTRVRDWVAELEKAVDNAELIVDQRLLERFMALNTRFAKLHKEGPRRLKQAPSARTRKSSASLAKPTAPKRPGPKSAPRSGSSGRTGKKKPA